MKDEIRVRAKSVITGAGFAKKEQNHKVVVFKSADKIPPMRSGCNWIRRKWVDTTKTHTWRAQLRNLSLVRDPWTGILSVDFSYRVDFFDEDKLEWIERLPNSR